ncbi:hypothetical protein KTJ32_17860 [Acinetobacter gyllenbergii]|uniref:hypothetical protein n=1 Tax=Acinetobacter gyllenbergii TaxID=134534 RepID=UPI0021D0E384|nr:hypothetical protein [Acinetobacter gyllenbergii]MCU4582864.1 hypothetical protein [Acinetobacter gyllenbergii]
MRRLIPFVFLLIASSAFAKNPCKDLDGIYYSIMKKRQQGTPIVKQMDLVDKTEKKLPNEKALHDLLRKAVISAYEEPRFQVEENQEKAAQDFANSWTTACYKSFS